MLIRCARRRGARYRPAVSDKEEKRRKFLTCISDVACHITDIKIFSPSDTYFVLKKLLVQKRIVFSISTRVK